MLKKWRSHADQWFVANVLYFVPGHLLAAGYMWHSVHGVLQGEDAEKLVAGTERVSDILPGGGVLAIAWD